MKVVNYCLLQHKKHFKVKLNLEKWFITKVQMLLILMVTSLWIDHSLYKRYLA